MPAPPAELVIGRVHKPVIWDPHEPVIGDTQESVIGDSHEPNIEGTRERSGSSLLSFSGYENMIRYTNIVLEHSKL